VDGVSKVFASRLVLATFGAAAVALAAAPVAAAAGADATIADLQSQGYIVQINWINGYNTKPLSTCTVTNVNNPDRSGAAPQPGATVYVDVRCPNHEDDDDGGDFGIGIGIG
jgi:hypothetical protein